MNKINVCVDDWTVKRAVIAGNHKLDLVLLTHKCRVNSKCQISPLVYAFLFFLFFFCRDVIFALLIYFGKS